MRLADSINLQLRITRKESTYLFFFLCVRSTLSWSMWLMAKFKTWPPDANFSNHQTWICTASSSVFFCGVACVMFPIA